MSPTPSYPGTPRWVKVVLLTGVILSVLIVVILLIGGDHGPARHLAP